MERYERMSAKTRWTNAPYPFDWRFLVSTGPFKMEANKGVYNPSLDKRSDVIRFSFVMVLGRGLDEFIQNAIEAKKTYEGGKYLKSQTDWLTVVAPPSPKWQTDYPSSGDNKITLRWDDDPEEYIDPISKEADFEGYRVYRAEGRAEPEAERPARDKWMLFS